MMKIFKVITVLFVLFVISGCTNTKLQNSWADPLNKKTYNNIMVIGISSNEMNQRVYETGFVADLRKHGINAKTSHEFLTKKDRLKFGNGKKGQFRKVVEAAIKDQGFDAVLITYVAAMISSEVYKPSMGLKPDYSASGYYGGYGYGGYGGYGNYGGYVTVYEPMPGTYVDEQDYTLESSLFDAKTTEIVWSARSNSYAPDSIEKTIQDVAKLLVDNLESRKLIK